jgi:hypothetical protein
VTSVRLDNTGKDTNKGARGSSAKTDDVDVIWQGTRRDDGIRLTCKMQRTRIVPENVDLRLVEHGPLCFTWVPTSVPAGTRDAIDLLDRLGVPVNGTNQLARAYLKKAEHHLANDVLAAAIRHRRGRSELSELEADLDGTPRGTDLGGVPQRSAER